MGKINGLNQSEMPREKLSKYGPEYLTDIELLAIILRVGIKGKNVLELSREILEYFNINQVSRKSYEELMSFEGIKNVKAGQIVALFELSRRLYSKNKKNGDKKNKKNKLLSSLDLYNEVKYDFLDLNEERVMIVLVNSKNNILKKEFINFGSINYSIIDIRKILKKVLLFDASGFFLIHNHPSGDSTPSQEDKNVTEKIKKVSSDIGIRFLDHIIIGDNYYSFFDEL